MNTETEGLSNRNVHSLIVVPYKQPTRIEINRRAVYVTALSRARECGTGPNGRKEIKFFIKGDKNKPIKCIN